MANFDIPVNMFTSANGSWEDKDPWYRVIGISWHQNENQHLEVVFFLLERWSIQYLEGSDVPVVAKEKNNKIGLVLDRNQFNL